MSSDSPSSVYGSITGRRISITDLARAKVAEEKWTMVTAYDALVAGTLEEAGVPVLLVGDSAAMVVFGHDSTLPVTLDEMVMLTAGVVRGTQRSLVVADLPFGSYQESPEQALRSATRLMKEAGAQAVKLEGGERVAPHIRLLVESGIPVMAHVGLTPQSVNTLGGYRVQGRGEAGHQLLDDALAVQEAGAFAVVLEVVPRDLAERVTKELDIPTIGIGAGRGTDAQVLVWQDLLGLTPGKKPKFVQPYADLRGVIVDAVQAWRQDVTDEVYPDIDHSYS
ncbi:MAG: 3-methyl-2-oxobutanoate hydroxymethyltransferase [Actinomycetia bacterium]|nr:3-methyl-2-oxobutanoate hydroxymethyltransferase [Actinomycetes bacterium]MCH9801098.1 3-methyl-2-oxobutanoate hydroxymethyltransferase [Actinomycetes bacterium]